MNSLCDFLAKAFDSVFMIQVISYKKLFSEDESRPI